MTSYLLGLATIPTAAAIIYTAQRIREWLLENRIIKAVVDLLLGRLMPQRLYDRATFAVRVALCRRIWGFDLPGNVSILITAGRQSADHEVWRNAAVALTDQLAPVYAAAPKPVEQEGPQPWPANEPPRSDAPKPDVPRAALLRAQAMCAGLNLTSATNGITSQPAKTAKEETR